MGDKNATTTNTVKPTKPHFLSFHFYQQYFNVDTIQVKIKKIFNVVGYLRFKVESLIA